MSSCAIASKASLLAGSSPCCLPSALPGRWVAAKGWESRPKRGSRSMLQSVYRFASGQSLNTVARVPVGGGQLALSCAATGSIGVGGEGVPPVCQPRCAVANAGIRKARSHSAAVGQAANLAHWHRDGGGTGGGLWQRWRRRRRCSHRLWRGTRLTQGGTPPKGRCFGGSGARALDHGGNGVLAQPTAAPLRPVPLLQASRYGAGGYIRRRRCAKV